MIVYPNKILGGDFVKFENTIKCHWSFVHLLREEDITQCDCSIIDEHGIEQMIFLGKATKESKYEVRIYKANPTDTYVPHHLDFKVKKYEANDEFASFFFSRFFFARRFVGLLRDLHPEYNIRPYQDTKS